MKEEEVAVEAKTGISSPVMLGGAKFLKAVGLRKKSIYAANDKLKHLFEDKNGESTIYINNGNVSNGDPQRCGNDGSCGGYIAYSGFTVRAWIMGEASDIKLTLGSVIEISRLRGYTLQVKVKDEILSTVEIEQLCRAYITCIWEKSLWPKNSRENLGHPCFLFSKELIMSRSVRNKRSLLCST
ncbi:UNVERIFIED_CONTAM: hypothetical protein Scaly_0020500 [Sesamum calycinum]|uniref:Uncharacterized protein n=1 Tax=Sesamum calycinum TaxID=2727403 RepID=A0AAW2ST33_9LAMI